MQNPSSLEKPFDPLLIKHFDSIRRIVGPRLLSLSNYLQDTEEATDLVVLCPIVSVKTPSLGVRIRSPLANKGWYNEFTIRSRSRRGQRTEIDKFLTGTPDWFFYGILLDDGSDFDVWHIIDVAIWARLYREAEERDFSDFWVRERSNGDGTAFKAFTIVSRTMKDAVIASNHPDHNNE